MLRIVVMMLRAVVMMVLVVVMMLVVVQCSGHLPLDELYNEDCNQEEDILQGINFLLLSLLRDVNFISLLLLQFLNQLFLVNVILKTATSSSRFYNASISPC